MPHPHPNPPLTVNARNAGFTLLGLLFLVIVLGLLLAAVGSTWRAAAEREKEADLLFIGDQYRRALASYHERTPGSAKRYPKKLEDLLSDPRFPHTVRHLRRLWRDPVTGGDWALLRDEAGGIQGVHSTSLASPRKTAGFPREYAAFEGAGRHADWVFLAGQPPASPQSPEGGKQGPETPPRPSP